MVTAEIAARARALRLRVGCTQDRFAALGGIDRTTVAHVEAGENMLTGHATRAAYARAVGISLDTLAAYLDGSIGLEDAIMRRRKRPAA